MGNVLRYDDYAKHARMMTDIHAKPKEKEAEADGVEVKKEKAAAAAKPAADKKKSLKRL